MSPSVAVDRSRGRSVGRGPGALLESGAPSFGGNSANVVTRIVKDGSFGQLPQYLPWSSASRDRAMILHIEIEQEVDGRWLAEVTELPGVLAYGVSRPDAVARVQALALRSLAERLEHGEAIPEFLQLAFEAA